jgi:8-oxo-dGTP diphosphatase
MISYVAGFYFSNNLQNVLLIRKKKPAWQFDKLNAIGGKIEENESPLEAMNREFSEETYWDGNTNPWIQFCKLTGDSFTVYFYCAQGKLSVSELQAIVRLQHNNATTENELIYIPTVADILDGQYPIIPNLAWLIPMALNNLKNLDSCKNFTISE